jgi:GT2 family glycosyltransferase
MFGSEVSGATHRQPCGNGQSASWCSVSVVIASVGRPRVLHETVLSILEQDHLPEEIVISVPAIEHVDSRTPALPRVRCVISPQGSCVQRNRGVRAMAKDAELVAFLDDDVELDPDYLRVVAETFAAHPDLVAANGDLIADGGPTQRFSRNEARAMLERRAAERPVEANRWLIDSGRIHGCHFTVRRSVFETLEFDERLPLYGWLEDVDLGRSCRKLGRVGCIGGARLVHLAEKGGRTSGLRYGFSQVMNPAYLRSKGNFTFAECVKNWRLALASNVLGTMSLNRNKFERLQGNLIALWMLLRGRVDPEHVTRLG